MKVTFSKTAYEDYCYWKETDEKIFNRINDLLKNVKESPFRGIGKPEPLKENLSGYWSRRITQEHRLVYNVSGKNPDQIITVIQCRYHY